MRFIYCLVIDPSCLQPYHLWYHPWHQWRQWRPCNRDPLCRLHHLVWRNRSSSCSDSTRSSQNQTSLTLHSKESCYQFQQAFEQRPRRRHSLVSTPWSRFCPSGRLLSLKLQHLVLRQRYSSSLNHQRGLNCCFSHSPLRCTCCCVESLCLPSDQFAVKRPVLGCTVASHHLCPKRGPQMASQSARSGPSRQP